MTALSADRPSTDPQDDLFGHAPFAKTLADSICRYPGSDGLVLALYGPWGSGKSTVLNYVRYFLDQRQEAERPVVVTFNPWWFSGQENLARAFLGQLQAVLPQKSAKFKQLGNLLGDFTESIGRLIDLTGYSGGAGAIIGKVFSVVKGKPKDVPALKSKISKVLSEAKQRILVVIDDIDRLTPEEVRQLFTVIKALADFPNVVYLLAFDRDVVVDAIKEQTRLPGERYLEKIVQVPFEIPPVDRESLREALSKRLMEVMAETPDGMFDEGYWTRVFWDGIDPLIRVPRDVVRFTNTLLVTYASVVGEVNPVDFIAIEALRVFAPAAYDAVRDNPGRFTSSRAGIVSSEQDGSSQVFHQAWQDRIPDERRSAAIALLRIVFPRLSTYEASWSNEWRKGLRVCVPELFPTYFRLSVPSAVVSRGEMLGLIALGGEPERLKEMLLAAVRKARPDGSSLARHYLQQLNDFVEKGIPEEYLCNFVEVLFDIGDQLTLAVNVDGASDFGIPFRAQELVYELLKRIAPAERLVIIRNSYAEGRAIAVLAYLLPHLVSDIDPPSRGAEGGLVDAATLEELKALTLERIRGEGDALLSSVLLPTFLKTWMELGGAAEVRTWCTQVTESEQGLLSFVSRFLRHYTRTDDRGVRRGPRLSTKRIGVYIDVDSAEKRLRTLRDLRQVPDAAREAVFQFLRERELIREGGNPENLFAFDD